MQLYSKADWLFLSLFKQIVCEKKTGNSNKLDYLKMLKFQEKL